MVANLDDQTVARIDPNTRTVTRVAVQDPPTGLATTSDAVWVVGSTQAASVTVRAHRPSSWSTVTKKRRLGNIAGEPGSVGTRGRAVWIAPSSGFLSRMDPRTANVVQRVDPNASPIAIAVGPDAIWVGDSHATTVTQSRSRPACSRPGSVMARARSLSGQVPCGSRIRSTTQSCR